MAAAQASVSWIVQKVAVDGVTFYEAFPVTAGATEADDKDTYQGNGDTTVVGSARHYAFGNDREPPGFRQGGSELSDGDQWSTDDQPAWWEGADGTAHNLTLVMRGSEGAFVTVPAGGAGVKVADKAALGAG